MPIRAIALIMKSNYSDSRSGLESFSLANASSLQQWLAAHSNDWLAQASARIHHAKALHTGA